MIKKHEEQFCLINDSLWLLIKGYVKQEKVYKGIMSDVLMIYIKNDQLPNKFTEQWWKEALENKLMMYPEHYKDTEYADFVGRFCIGISDYWAIEQQRKTDNVDFYKCVAPAFVREWEKLRSNSDLE
jgi:hypothetical protein